MKIRVVVGGRPYPITVNSQEEEEVVRKAAEQVNNKLDDLQESYEGDQQDFLAMTSLIFATESLKQERQVNQQSEAVDNQLSTIEEKLQSLLDG